jgi:hypothetical protein
MTDVVTTTEPAAVMGEDEARKLTTKIRKAAENLLPLILRAHDGGAWKALGYTSWSAYVGGELTVGIGQAGRLLAQARAIKELSAATGLPPARVPLSARGAAELGPEGVRDVAEAVRREEGTNPLLEKARSVREAIEARRAAAREAAPPEPEATEAGEAPQTAHAPAEEPKAVVRAEEPEGRAARRPDVTLPSGEVPQHKLDSAAKVLQQILELPPVAVAQTYMKMDRDQHRIHPNVIPNLIEAWAAAFANEIAPF